MKILMAESTDVYHDGRVLKEAESLASAGYEVELLGFRSAKSVIRKFPFKIVGLLVVSRRWRFFRNLSIMLNVTVLNMRILLTSADIYHAHNVMFLMGMSIASRLRRARLVYDCHEVQHEEGRLQGWLEKRFIQEADLIINVAEGRAAQQALKFGLNVENIQLIYNYPVLPDCEYKKRPIGDAVRMVYCGGFNLRDNRLDDFLHILREVPEATLDLLAFGYRDSHETMERLIVELGLNDRVRFIPLVPLPKLIPTLMEYDVAVDMLTNPENSISKRYPAINKMFEYLAAGLPTICSNMPAFEDELVDKRLAISINPKDRVESVAKVQAFIANKELLMTIGEKAHSLSATEFNWGPEGRKLVDAYSKLISTRN